MLTRKARIGDFGPTKTPKTMTVASSQHKLAFQQYDDQQPQPMEGVTEIDANAQNQEPQQCLLFIDMHGAKFTACVWKTYPLTKLNRC